MHASAAEIATTQDGLAASIITEKDSYNADESIEMTFKATNTNSYSVNNVSLEALIPEGLSLSGESKETVKSVSELAAGESIELKLTAVKKGSEQGATVPDEGNTDNSENPANGVENSNSNSDKSGNSTDKAQNADSTDSTSATNTVSANKNTDSDNSVVATGENAAWVFAGLICLLGALAVAYFVKNKKAAKRSLSVVLSLCIAAGAAAAVALPVAASSGKESFTVEKTIKADGEDCTIKACVTYEKAAQSSGDEAVTRGQWVNMLAEKFSMDLSNVESKENPFDDIADSPYYSAIVGAYYYAVLPDEGESFKPDSAATRDFAAYTLNNCLGYVKMSDLACDDFDSIKYQDAASALVERGYFELVGNKFMPEKAVTKTEMSKIIVLIDKVNESTEIDENYDNNVEYNDEVVTLPESDVISKSDNIIVLTLNEDTENLKVGNAFIVKPADETAVYSSYKIDEVTFEDGKVTVKTSDASLGDILSDIDIQGRATAQVSSSALRSSRNIKYSNNKSLDEDKLTFSKDVIKLPEKGIELTVSGGLKNPVIDYAVDIDFAQVANISVPTSINNVYVALSDTFEIGGDFKIDLQKFSGEAATVNLVTYEVSLYEIIGARVQVDINISADGEVSLSYSLNNTIGAQLTKNEGFRAIKDFKSNSFTYDVKITAAIEPKLEVSLLVCELELLSADATLGAHGLAETKNFDKEKFTTNHTTFNAYISISFSAGIGGDLKNLLNKAKEISLFGYKPLGNMDVSKLTATLTVWDNNNSPAQINIHLENGEVVDQCTYRYIGGTVKCNGFPVENVDIKVYDGDKEISLKDGESNITTEAGNFGFLLSAPAKGTNYSEKLTFAFSKDGYKDTKLEKTVKPAQDTELGTIEMTEDTGSGGDASIFEQMPNHYVFSSGTGAWSTYLNVEDDGSFTGNYHDADMGDTGYGFPYGTVYLCNFEGKFSAATKIDEYTYSIKLESLEMEETPGYEYYDFGTKYIYADPYGINDGEEFLIYLPGISLDSLSNDFLLWGRTFFDTDVAFRLK